MEPLAKAIIILFFLSPASALGGGSRVERKEMVVRNVVNSGLRNTSLMYMGMTKAGAAKT